MGVAMDQLVVILLAASVAGQDYGPVSLDDVDALTLNWNQIQWLVKDQIKEVEELREEHNELYNEITRCFGNEKCLAEFELLDMSPGSKLHGLGLRTSSSSYSRGSGGGQQAQGQMFFGRNSPISSGGPLFSSVNTTFGQTPIVYERRYEYSQSSHNRGRHSG